MVGACIFEESKKHVKSTIAEFFRLFYFFSNIYEFFARPKAIIPYFFASLQLHYGKQTYTGMMGETEFNAYDENGNRPLADNETEGLLRRFATWLVKYWWAVPLYIVLQAALFLLVIFQFPGGWMESLVSIIFLVIIIIELIKFVIL